MLRLRLPVSLTVLAATALFFLSGCAGSSGDVAVVAPVGDALPSGLRAFPQQAPIAGERAMWTALAGGRLQLVDGCLRLVGPDFPDTAGHLIIWPADHTVKDEDGVLVIYDGADTRVAQEGDDIWMGGGEDNRTEPIADSAFGLQASTPPECPGPYWIMGEIEQPAPADVGPTPPSGDAESLEVQNYMAEFGVSAGEASRRLQLMDDVSLLYEKLIVHEPEAFVELRVEHTPEFRVIISVRPGGQAAVLPYIQGGPLEGVIQVVEAGEP